jgi:hypothetical protein
MLFSGTLVMIIIKNNVCWDIFNSGHVKGTKTINTIWKRDIREKKFEYIMQQ